MSNGRLAGRVAVVTGGAQGLGEAICRRLAAEGVAVAVADLNEAGAAVVAAGLRAAGARSLAQQVDVTREADVARLVAAVESELGEIDLLVANAGVIAGHEITEFPLADWDRVMAVNATGYFLCAREAARVMSPRRRGVILQINSKSGKKGSYRNAAYAASKFAGIGLTQSMALDLAPYGVRVNAVCPGNLLESPMWKDELFDAYASKWGITPEEVRRKYVDQVPLGRGCTYDDVCNVVVFLASDEAAYLTGQAINVTGGQQLSP